MNESHHIRWKSMIGLGLLSILVGLFMLFLPAVTTKMFVLFSGIFVIMLSAVYLIEGLFIDHDGISKWVVPGLGILGIIVGIIIALIPSLLIFATGTILGIFLIIFGIGEGIIGFCMVIAETMVRFVFFIIGLFAIVMGILMLINPVLTADILAWLAGLYILIFGMIQVAHGLNERSAEKKMTVKHL